MRGQHDGGDTGRRLGVNSSIYLAKSATNASRGSNDRAGKQMGYTEHVKGSENESALDGEAPDW